MFKNVEHIGIAVKNINQSNVLYTQLLGVAPYKQELVETEKVLTSFFKIGTTKIELLEATHPESPIAKFIEKKGEGIHHIAYEVDDILNTMNELQQNNFILLNETPKKGADNKLVCFIHPKTCNGVLIEICQEIN